ncbi:GLPGLI family protein [Leptobacterium flavescens]|uniref:GLPGLI family protein n=1 Tax=Leptobacterium flavescens TaxID=472055 RepID=A0A6P0UI40_9FLAO|nr:GLPGLI family protein [Leptobacterium flavescens]NER12955.1 GLPGLI family protein [Leptobacterium flavescens]
MKKIFYLIVFSLSNIIVAQNGTYKNNMTLNYEMHINLGKLKQYNSTLYIQNNRSFFHWNDTTNKSATSTDEFGNYKFHLDITDETGTINYTDFGKGSLLTRSLRFKEVIILEENNPRIKWDLKEETKKIGSFTCHKAIGEFRGRIYTAWYTLDVPVNAGPWKLQGLPGLILEAYDKEKFVQFYFKSIKTSGPQKAFDYSKIFEEGKRISVQEYAESQKNLANDLVKKLKSKFPRGVTVSVESTSENFLERDFGKQ